MQEFYSFLYINKGISKKINDIYTTILKQYFFSLFFGTKIIERERRMRIWSKLSQKLR